jgi:hypothetical protein
MLETETENVEAEDHKIKNPKFWYHDKPARFSRWTEKWRKTENRDE